MTLAALLVAGLALLLAAGVAFWAASEVGRARADADHAHRQIQTDLETLAAGQKRLDEQYARVARHLQNQAEEARRIGSRPPVVVEPDRPRAPQLRPELRDDRSPSVPVDPGGQTPVGEPGPASDVHVRDWTAKLVIDYARLADDPSGAVDTFMDRYVPEGVSVSGGAYTLGEDPGSAFLWAVRATPTLYALVPGQRALRNWDSLFAGGREAAARETFGPAFQFTADTPRFALRRPAALQKGDAGLAVREPGVLEGFTS